MNGQNLQNQPSSSAPGSRRDMTWLWWVVVVVGLTLYIVWGMFWQVPYATLPALELNEGDLTPETQNELQGVAEELNSFGLESLDAELRGLEQELSQ